MILNDWPTWDIIKIWFTWNDELTHIYWVDRNRLAIDHIWSYIEMGYLMSLRGWFISASPAGSDFDGFGFILIFVSFLFFVFVSVCFLDSPSGCTFWGKKPWSRKKKILWQLGTLVGAPVGIGLLAGIAVPAMIIGIPVWVGRKLLAHYKTQARPKRNAIVASGVAASVRTSSLVCVCVCVFLFFSFLFFLRSFDAGVENSVWLRVSRLISKAIGHRSSWQVQLDERTQVRSGFPLQNIEKNQSWGCYYIVYWL